MVMVVGDVACVDSNSVDSDCNTNYWFGFRDCFGNEKMTESHRTTLYRKEGIHIIDDFKNGGTTKEISAIRNIDPSIIDELIRVALVYQNVGKDGI